MAEARREWWRIACFTIPAIMLAGSLSGWLSNSGYGNDWFDALAKPSFMPPGWLFGGVWPLLHFLLGLAGGLLGVFWPPLSSLRALAVAWFFAHPDSKPRRNALILFFAQLALNFAW